MEENTEQRIDLTLFSEKIQGLKERIASVIVGQEQTVDLVLTAILANGHVLIEGVPGVAKTLLARLTARLIDADFSRVQFTPDVLPADITGFSLYRKELGSFEYQEGAVMCNLFLADEINRTSPKTQSALLEAMEERNVTVDGVTHVLPEPFHVIATENPIGSAGTQMLPESQLDRFMISLQIGYPEKQDELKILMSRDRTNPMDALQPVIFRDELKEMQKLTEEVRIHQVIYEYIINLVDATRKNEMIELGVSPRGALALAKMAKASAFLSGRSYVIPNDVSDVFLNVAEHRIRLSSKGRLNHLTAEKVLGEVLDTVKKPVPQRR